MPGRERSRGQPPAQPLHVPSGKQASPGDRGCHSELFGPIHRPDRVVPRIGVAVSGSSGHGCLM